MGFLPCSSGIKSIIIIMYYLIVNKMYLHFYHIWFANIPRNLFVVYMFIHISQNEIWNAQVHYLNMATKIETFKFLYSLRWKHLILLICLVLKIYFYKNVKDQN